MKQQLRSRNRATLLDVRRSRGFDRPRLVPTVIDEWPETIQCPCTLIVKVTRPIRVHVHKLFFSPPPGPGGPGGRIIQHFLGSCRR